MNATVTTDIDFIKVFNDYYNECNSKLLLELLQHEVNHWFSCQLIGTNDCVLFDELINRKYCKL